MAESGNVKSPWFYSVLRRPGLRKEDDMQKTAKGEREENLPGAPQPGILGAWGSLVLALILLVHPSPFPPKLAQV